MSDSRISKRFLLAPLLALIVVGGFTFYMSLTYVYVGEKYVATTVPAQFGEIRALPQVVYQKPLSAFTLYNYSSKGFGVETSQIDAGVVHLFPLIASQAPSIAYVISNLTLSYSTLGVMLLAVNQSLVNTLVAAANQTLAADTYLASQNTSAESYVGPLSGSQFMLFYFTQKILGTTYYVYVILAWSNSQVALLQYKSTMPLAVNQLDQLTQMVLSQSLQPPASTST
jgi:hypothetical protein